MFIYEFIKSFFVKQPTCNALTPHHWQEFSVEMKVCFNAVVSRYDHNVRICHKCGLKEIQLKGTWTEYFGDVEDDYKVCRDAYDMMNEFIVSHNGDNFLELDSGK